MRIFTLNVISENGSYLRMTSFIHGTNMSRIQQPQTNRNIPRKSKLQAMKPPETSKYRMWVPQNGWNTNDISAILITYQLFPLENTPGGRVVNCTLKNNVQLFGICLLRSSWLFRAMVVSPNQPNKIAAVFFLQRLFSHENQCFYGSTGGLVHIPTNWIP